MENKKATEKATEGVAEGEDGEDEDDINSDREETHRLPPGGRTGEEKKKRRVIRGSVQHPTQQIVRHTTSSKAAGSVMARASTANATLQERMEREKEERAQRTTAATNKRGDVRTKVGGRRNYFTPKPKENVFQTALFLHETSKDPWDQLPGPDTPAVTTDVTLSQLRPGYDYFIRVGPGGPGSGTMTYRGKLREWRQGDPDIPDDDEAWWNADTGRWETIPDGCVRHLGPPEPSKRLLKKVGLPGAATADFNAVLSQMGLRLNDGVSEHGYQDQNMDGDEDHEMDGEDDDIEMETPGSDNNGDDEGDGEALNARRPDDEQEEEGGEERYHRRSHEDEDEEEEGVEQPRDQGEDEGVEQGHDDGEEETRAPFQREDEDETENSDYSEGVRERKAVNALRAKTGARPLDEDSADERHRDEEDLREMQMDVDANTGEGDRKVKGKGKGREVTEEREDSGFTALNIDDLLVMDNDDDDDDDDDDIEEESSATRRGPLNAAQKAAIKQAANTFRNLATEYRVSLPRIMREANLDVIHARGTSAWNAFQAWQRINGSRPSDPNEILEWSTGMRERYAATIAGKTKAEVKTLMETWVTEVKKVGGDSDVVNRLSVARKRLGEIAANIASYGDAEVLIALVPLSENRVAPQLRTLMSGSGLMQQLIAREANKVVINKVLNGYSCLAQSIKNGSVKPEDVSLEQMFQFGDASTTVAKPWSWEQGPKEDHRDWKRRIVGRLFPNIFLRDLGEEKFQLYEPWNIPSILIRCRVAIVGWPHGVRIPEEGWKIRMLNSAELDSLEHAIQRKDGHQLRLQPLFEDDEEADEFNDEIGGSDWLDTAIVWVHQGATTKLKSGLIIRDCKSYCERRDAKMHGHEDGHSVTPSPSPSRRKRPRRKDMTKARSTKLASKNRKTSNTSKTSTSGDEGQKETTSTGPTTRGPKARPPKTPNPRRRKRARVEDSSEVEDPTPRPKIVTHAPIPFKLDANLTSSEADAPVLARPIAAAGTQRMPAAGNRPTPAAGTRPIIPLAHARAMPIAGGQSARIRPQPNQPFARATRGEHMPLVNMARSSQPPVLGAVRQQQLRFPPAPRQQSRDIANVGVVHRAPPTNAAYRPPPIQHNAVAGPSRPRDPWHAVQGRAARNPQRQYFVVDNTGYVQDEYAPDGYDDDEYMGEQYMGDAYGDVGAYDGGVAYSFQHEQDAGGNRFFGGRA